MLGLLEDESQINKGCVNEKYENAQDQIRLGSRTKKNLVNNADNGD